MFAIIAAMIMPRGGGGALTQTFWQGMQIGQAGALQAPHMVLSLTLVADEHRVGPETLALKVRGGAQGAPPAGPAALQLRQHLLAPAKSSTNLGICEDSLISMPVSSSSNIPTCSSAESLLTLTS